MSNNIWGPVFILTGLAVLSDGPAEVGYRFRECLLCGASVSEELLARHEEWHDSVCIKVGRQANNGKLRLS